MEEIKNTDKIETIDTNKSESGLPDDLFGKHNVMTRLIGLVIVGIFVYAFIIPLPIEYAQLSGYLLMGALLVLTFGLNSLKVIGSLIEKWKK